MRIEGFKLLPAKEKEEYLNNLFKKTLDLNQEGVTISQIKDGTGLTYSTIWHHLEMLSSTCQCQKISRGNLDIYYPPGNISILEECFDTKGKARYIISALVNEHGHFVCLHEKKLNRVGTYTIISGITVPIELIGEIIETIKNVKIAHLDAKAKNEK